MANLTYITFDVDDGANPMGHAVEKLWLQLLVVVQVLSAEIVQMKQPHHAAQWKILNIFSLNIFMTHGQHI